MSSLLVMYSLRRAVHELSSDAPAKVKTMRASLYEEVAAPRSDFVTCYFCRPFSVRGNRRHLRSCSLRG